MLRVVTFGGCPLYNPIKVLRQSKMAAHLYKGMGFKRAPFALSSGAAVQLLRFLKGELDIPKQVRDLCYADSDHVPLPSQRALLTDRSDLILVEMSTPIEILYDGFVLNNNRVKDRFQFDVRRRHRGTNRMLSRWRSIGIQKKKEKVRAEAAAELLARIPADSEEDRFARDVIERTRVRETKTAEIVADLSYVRANLPLPMGIIIHNFNYMPDGRPVSWPSDFRDNCYAAARELGVPLFDPAAFVAAYGAPAAMKQDMRHYSAEFAPIMANEFYRFMHQVLGKPAVAERPLAAAAA